MKCLILFSRKNITNLLSAELAKRVVYVNWLAKYELCFLRGIDTISWEVSLRPLFRRGLVCRKANRKSQKVVFVSKCQKSIKCIKSQKFVECSLCCCPKHSSWYDAFFFFNKKSIDIFFLFLYENICFHGEIRKIFTWYPLLSRPVPKYAHTRLPKCQSG